MKFKLLLILFFTVGTSLSVHAQFALHNITYFNGYDVSCTNLYPEANGDIMWIGNISSNGPFNFPNPPGQGILFMRLDKDFNVLNAKIIQGGAIATAKCKDGGYLLTGLTSTDTGLFAGHPPPPPPALRNIFVMKTDSLGNFLWVNTISGLYSYNYQPSSVIETIDGGAFIVGIEDSTGGDFPSHYGPMYYYDWFLAKFDAQGQKLWVQNKGGSGNDMYPKIIPDGHGGMYVTGYSYSNDYDMVSVNSNVLTYGFGYVGHWDSAGNTVWGRCIGGSGDDRLFDIYYDTVTASVVVCGKSNSIDYDLLGHVNNSGQADFWVIRLDTSGTIKWSKAWGGDREDHANCIGKNSSTGNFLVGGYSQSKNGDLDSLHTQLNNDYDGWLIAIDTNGVLKRKRQIGGNKNEGISKLVSSANSIYVFGGTASTDGDFATHNPLYTSDSWFLTVLQDYPDAIPETIREDEDVVVYPNPTMDRLYINLNTRYSYILYDMQGREVHQGINDIHEAIQLHPLVSGIYLLELKWEGNKAVRKINKL